MLVVVLVVLVLGWVVVVLVVAAELAPPCTLLQRLPDPTVAKSVDSERETVTVSCS